MSTTKSSPPPKTTDGSENPVPVDLTTSTTTMKQNGFGNMEKRWTFHPYRFQKDDDVVCLSRTEKKPDEEYSAASPSYTPCSPTYPPSSPSLPDLFRNDMLTARERTFLNINNSIPEMKPRAKMNHTVYRRQPTASMLINESVPSRKIENDQIYLFCKSNRHSAVSCINNHLSLEEKVEICKQAGSCFRCLNHKIKKRHLSSSWGRANVKCDLCSGRHVTVMCMGKGKALEDFSKTENNDSALK
ncbi:hypothetical protein TNCT_180611 [Trichonephila clavata]|uniref:Uncharacterized protein n=1 Tax=Trichonephila clavata TaxID=2740835 RepID=A0A8X6JMH7_TRICU|nr:hypothetical protein TNCT_180611 [Trichonephila clavata]